MKTIAGRTILGALVAMGACGCSQEPLPADVTGRYGQSGSIGSLELHSDGTYECFVMNGLTADGCGTFVGAGISKGSWIRGDDAIAFEPIHEPADLVVKLAEATAVPVGDGLLVTVAERPHFLPWEGPADPKRAPLVAPTR